MSRVLCRVAGQWVDHWPATDRGLQYGDGLFETMRLVRVSDASRKAGRSGGDVPLWQFHAERLQQGLNALLFPADSFAVICDAMGELADEVDLSAYSAAKLLVSRGVGQRGYGLPDHPEINIQIQLMDAPPWSWSQLHPGGVCIGVSAVRLGAQPRLAGIKHLNRLEQVLARAEFEPDWQEAVMLDTAGNVTEGCYSNLYIAHKGQWLTPIIDQCGVNGVIRRWLIAEGQVKEAQISLAQLEQADAIALSNSLTGIVPVKQLQQRLFDTSHSMWQPMKRMQQRLESLF
ncbi:aminodeoxychorismate lyase [Oceanobacter kriegii]|uniref:aminodeoxychorismate lyase n=1 Tax=Oceanobacter kriegii TaxID=64972 RepID=UPI0003F7587E|nr:aminodeoxychorismate lyase [Oceanobacter kriegii]